MSRKNRRDVIDDSVVGAYHIWTRCARRAFLAGLDLVTGLDFCHRKTWITQRIEELSKVFAVECCDDTVMDNHLHLILRNRPDKAHEWSAEEVARRWLLLNRSAIDLEPAPTQREIEALASDRKQIAELRKRLASISWYMGSLKQAISVMANDEDDATGAFFAERFGCRRLKDEPALLTCSLYINMNPIRAGVVDDLNEPQFTSLYARVEDRREDDSSRTKSGALTPVHVDGDGYDGVAAGRRLTNKGYLGITLDEYLDLMDGLVQRHRVEQLGGVQMEYPPILERLGITTAAWETSLRLTSRRFGRELEKSAAHQAEARRRTNDAGRPVHGRN